jgi:hypothetical protein
MVGVLIYGVLHLAEDVIDVDEVFLGARAGHGQVILLCEGVLARWWAGVNRSRSRLRHVLLSSSHRAVGDGKVAVKGHQRAANLGIGRRVNLAALGAAEEVINHVVGALTIITASGGAIAKVLSTGVVDGWLVEVKTIVGRRLRSIVTTTGMGLVSKSSGIGPHLASMVVVAGRSLGRLWPVVESALGVLGWSDEHRVIGVSLDMLLQVLGTLERLATELTLVRLQGNVNTDVRGDVISLDCSSSARVPLASQVEVVCALATNMALTNVLVEHLGSRELLVTGVPSADEVVVVWCWRSIAALGGVWCGARCRRHRLGVIARTARGRICRRWLLLLLKLRLLLRTCRRHDGNNVKWSRLERLKPGGWWVIVKRLRLVRVGLVVVQQGSSLGLWSIQTYYKETRGGDK